MWASREVFSAGTAAGVEPCRREHGRPRERPRTARQEHRGDGRGAAEGTGRPGRDLVACAQGSADQERLLCLRAIGEKWEDAGSLGKDCIGLCGNKMASDGRVRK